MTFICLPNVNQITKSNIWICPFDPIRAVYGFVSYLLSSAALAAYLVWLLLPQEYLEATGLSEVFPQKYWAVAVPIYLGVR